MNALDCKIYLMLAKVAHPSHYQVWSTRLRIMWRRGNFLRAMPRSGVIAILGVVFLTIEPAGQQSTVQAQQNIAAKRTARPRVTNARISRKGKQTIFSIQLSKPASPAASPQVFTLAGPYRVIIDLPSVEFALVSVGPGTGLIRNYRYGAFAPGKSRIVLDVRKPVVVRKTITRDGRVAGAWTFSVVMEETDDIGFLLKPPPRSAAKRARSNSNRRESPKLRRSKRNANSRPVIVIDAGHGGIDPGTIGTGRSREKDVTMAVARRLRSILQRKKRYVVAMTRTRDTFVSLDQRVEFSNRHGADLFISIHADAIGNKKLAARVRGATVYTLSERASDDQARQLAKKENSVDALAGIPLQGGKKGVQVKTILIDLLKRETSNLSTNFSNLLLKRFKGRIPIHGKTTKAAAFHVLKQTRTPSVLIELGYMSNRRDEKRLNSIRWQKKIAHAIAVAIDKFFTKRVAGRR